MKVDREWNDNPELFEDIYSALEDAGLNVIGSEEQGRYGEDGTLTVRNRNTGQTFYLNLAEEVI